MNTVRFFHRTTINGRSFEESTSSRIRHPLLPSMLYLFAGNNAQVGASPPSIDAGDELASPLARDGGPCDFFRFTEPT
jgi:hypothetical protein